MVSINETSPQKDNNEEGNVQSEKINIININCVKER